ncbi:MAG TPA: flavin reductase family protein [Gemmatimonadales bacterium]|nr:flavin reductase family protein [Gemmatimonadales bacterium]
MPSPVLALFRRLTNGVYVIGVSHDGRSNAFTAAWLTQVSFDPLLVSLSINPDHFSYQLLQGSGVFTVNILKQGQLDVARHFGCRSGGSTDKFAGVPWRPGRLGAPILLDAAGYLECRVVGGVPAGDHEVVVGRAANGELLDPEATILRYSDTGDMDESSALYPERF